MQSLAPEPPQTYLARGAPVAPDPRVIWILLRKHWQVLAGSLVLCLLMGVTYTLLQIPIYYATATVMIDQRKETVVKSDQVLSDLQMGPNTQKADVVDTEVELLRSPRIAESVVRRLHLEANPNFNGAIPPHGLLKEARRAFARLRNGPSPPLDAESKHQNAVATVQANLTVNRRGLTPVIDLLYSSENPETATVVANAYAQAYLDSQVEDKVSATQEANKWLEDRVAEMRGEVTSAERNVAQYQSNNGLLMATGSQLNEQRVSQLQLDESAARADLAEKQARLSTARSQLAQGASGEALGQALNSPVIQALRGQIAQAQQKQGDLLSRYGPKYPDVINSQHDISAAQAQIREEIGRIIGSLESDVTAARSRLSTIQSSLAAARGSLAGDKTAAVQGNELDRNAQAKRSLYQSYLDRLQQTSTQTGLARPDASLVTAAMTPDRPTTPNLKLNMLVATLIGGSIGLSIIALLELLNQGLQTSTQVEQRLGERAAGSVPLLKKSDGPPVDYLVKKPLSAFSESFRKLRVFVQHSEGPSQVLALTSALPTEGKTTTAYCFARSLALSGAKVILLDCDIRMRALSKIWGAAHLTGLLNVLKGEAKLDQALLRDASSEAHLLPAGVRDGAQQIDLLGSQEMRHLIAHLKTVYDFVIIDSPPALAVSDALTVADLADGVIFLLRSNTTSSRAADFALQALRTAGANVFGVVLTYVDLRAQSQHGYGDSAYFYKKYSQYYEG